MKEISKIKFICYKLKEEDKLDSEAERWKNKEKIENDMFYKDDSGSDISTPDRPMISMRGGNINKVVDESLYTLKVKEPYDNKIITNNKQDDK